MPGAVQLASTESSGKLADTMTMPTLETPRLLLQPLSIEDADQIQVLFPHWDVVRLLNGVVPWPYPADGALIYVRDIALPAVARGDEWIWTLRLKSAPDRIIGSIGLKRADDENRGFWLGLPWHGQGLMTEAADAVTDYWFDVLGFAVLRVPKAVANTASRKISQKQGMRVIAVVERDYVSGRHPAEIWEIRADEWRARRRHKDVPAAAYRVDAGAGADRLDEGERQRQHSRVGDGSHCESRPRK